MTGSGLEGGASRTLVFLNFPVALAAIAFLLVLLDRLEAVWERGAAVVAIGLCAAVFFGTVDQANLDAWPVNAIAAVGVALALGLTLRAGVVSGLDRLRGDPVRLVAGVVLVVLGLPWIAADLGFSLGSLSVLGDLYLTGELRTQPGDPVFHQAVHPGHHHGMDGVLLVAIALVLSRLVPAIRAHFLRGLVGATLR